MYIQSTVQHVYVFEVITYLFTRCEQSAADVRRHVYVYFARQKRTRDDTPFIGDLAHYVFSGVITG
jgi:hypothetical protein